LDAAQAAIPFRASLRSIVPVDHWEIVCNGRVVRTLRGNDGISGEENGTISMTESGWCLVRASSDKAEYPVLDNYVYATTSPVYVAIARRAPHSPEDAKYFVEWMDRVMAMAARYAFWNSDAEKQIVLKRLAAAKAIYKEMR
jgi:TolB protein